jgi:hypothetical protein
LVAVRHRVDPKSIKASSGMDRINGTIKQHWSVELIIMVMVDGTVVDFHRSEQVSLLSAEAPQQDFRGLYNLAGLALVPYHII